MEVCPDMKILTICLTLLCPLLSIAQNEECTSLRVIFWNMESGDSNDAFLGDQMAAKGTVDIWGLSEVRNQSALDTFESKIEAATGLQYRTGLSDLGGGDRLAILFREDRLNLIDDPAEDDDGFFEVDEVAASFGLRPAFCAKLEGATTGQQFIFAVNHFKCCAGTSEEEKRVNQSRALNAFTRAQTVPVIAGGDYNFFIDPDDPDEPTEAFEVLTEEGPFEWVRPEVFAETQPRGSVLDHVFVANKVEGWSAEAVILNRDGNAPVTAGSQISDNSQATDHRPIQATFTLHCGDHVDQLIEEIEELKGMLATKEAELQRLLAQRN